MQLLEGYQIKEIEAQAGAVYAIVVERGSVAARLPVQAVFVDLGLVPSVQMVRQLVQLDPQGFIVVDAKFLDRIERQGCTLYRLEPSMGNRMRLNRLALCYDDPFHRDEI